MIFSWGTDSDGVQSGDYTFTTLPLPEVVVVSHQSSGGHRRSTQNVVSPINIQNSEALLKIDELNKQLIVLMNKLLVLLTEQLKQAQLSQ